MQNSAHSEIAGYRKICRTDELKDACGKRFLIDTDSGQTIEIALFKINETVHAVSNICPHQHTALIYDGFIEDGCVVCPVHGWMFDLESGKTKSGNGRLKVYEVKVIDEEVFVKITGQNYSLI